MRPVEAVDTPTPDYRNNIWVMDKKYRLSSSALAPSEILRLELRRHFMDIVRASHALYNNPNNAPVT